MRLRFFSLRPCWICSLFADLRPCICWCPGSRRRPAAAAESSMCLGHGGAGLSWAGVLRRFPTLRMVTTITIIKRSRGTPTSMNTVREHIPTCLAHERFQLERLKRCLTTRVCVPIHFLPQLLGSCGHVTDDRAHCSGAQRRSL